MTIDRRKHFTNRGLRIRDHFREAADRRAGNTGRTQPFDPFGHVMLPETANSPAFTSATAYPLRTVSPASVPVTLRKPLEHSTIKSIAASSREGPCCP